MSRHVFTPEERCRGGQVRASRPDFREHQRRNFNITAERYGEDWALRKVAAWRAAHGSAGERWLAGLLEAWGLLPGDDFWREVPVALPDGRRVFLDYVVASAGGRRLVIEVDGAQHDATCDAARDRALLALGYPTLRLPSALIRRRPQEATRRVREALRDA